MKKLFTLLIVTICSTIIFGQVFDWQWQNPKPHGNALRTVELIAPNTVIAFGDAGTVQKSTDNGNTWQVKYIDQAIREFRGASFVSASVGYACGSDGLLVKTTDGGETFTQLNPGTDVLLYSIAFVDADTGYVGGASGTLLKTTDGGTTWNTIATGITNAIYSVNAPSANAVFFATNSVSSVSYTKKSTDYGATWETITPAGITQTQWSVFFLNATTGWVTVQSNGRVFRTTDGGSSWNESTTNALVVPNYVYFKDANVGLVTNNNNGDVFVSTDGGATWTATPASTEPQYAAFFEGTIAFSVGRSGTCYRSSDGAATFNELSQSVTVTQLRQIKFFNSTTGMATAGSSTAGDSLGFLIKTTNGGDTWEQMPYNFKHLVYSFATPSTNVWYIGRGRNAIFKTTDAGATFVEQPTPVTSATAHFYDIGFTDENNGYAFTSNGAIIKTTNGGTTWENANTPFGTTAVYGGHVFNANKVIAAGGSAKAFMTTDGGANWTAIVTGIPGNFFTTRFLNNDFGIIAGYNSPAPVASKTTDGGTTWIPLSLPSDYDGSSLWSVGFKDTSTFWLGGINGSIYYTTDGGNSWTKSKPVTGNTLYSFAVVGNDMWISGTQGTILKGFVDPLIPVEMVSFNASVSGNSVNLVWKTATELNNKGFEVERKYEAGNWTKIAFVSGNGTTTETNVYSYTDNAVKNGKVSYRLKQVDFDGSFEYSDIVEANIGTPDKFELLQNYPNPFNPTTSIKYTLPAKSKVELRIYNILGKEVANLVNEMQDAGSYEVSFNASGLSSGVYFYELNAGSFNSKKKMVLIK